VARYVKMLPSASGQCLIKYNGQGESVQLMDKVVFKLEQFCNSAIRFESTNL